MHDLFKGILFFAIILSLPYLAFGSGYEVPTQYSAEYSPMVGNVTSYVRGPQAMNFNVAGIAGDKGNEVELTVAPLYSMKDGAYIQDTRTKVDWDLNLPISANFKFGVSDKLSFGIGTTYLGTAVKKDSLDYSSIHSSFANYKPSESQKFTDAEVTLGLAYAFNDNFKFGVGWRIAMISGKFEGNSVSIFPANSVQTGVPATTVYGLTHLELADLKDTVMDSFRVGMMYESDSKVWGLGLSFRSKLTYELEGKIRGKVYYSSKFVNAAGFSNEANLTEDVAKMKSNIPMQLHLGGHYFIAKNWVMLGDYSFTQYSRLGSINYDARINIPATIFGAATSSRMPDVPMHWKDFHTFGVSSEYITEGNWAFRGGVIYMSQVVDNYTGSFSSPTPGPGLGGGFGFGKKNLFKNFDLNFGFAYARFHGKIEKSDQNRNRPTIGGTTPHPSYDGVNGEHTTHAAMGLIGGNYRF